MPIIVHRFADGQTGPCFQCCHCAKLITDAANGILVWTDDFSGEVADIKPLVLSKPLNAETTANDKRAILIH